MYRDIDLDISTEISFTKILLPVFTIRYYFPSEEKTQPEHLLLYMTIVFNCKGTGHENMEGNVKEVYAHF